MMQITVLRSNKLATYHEVQKILSGLKNDFASGYDNIPIKYIKPFHEYLVSPLVHIINNCIDQKIFPYSWKVAKVCPIPKVDHTTSIEEYRPISVLPVLSKVYERVILHQLCAYIDNATLYNTTQSGFRKGHSTSTILLKIRDDIIRAMNRSEVTLAILIDYSKAFDTIEHELLLTKLLKLGFSVDAIKILHSYLTDRNQYVQIDDKSSSLSSSYIFWCSPG